ncbi:MAG: DUF4199 domain-containing protein [Cyclobacteriaceae bacterium]|nr:DUF4199 domain-containing protein [Cyclobacteriaceae bacterium SS2]
MEDQPNATIRSVSIKYGLILGMIGIIYFILLDFLGKAQDQGWNYLGIVFSIVAFYFAYKEFKEDGDGYMTYGQGLGIGTLASLISSVISGIFTVVYINYINSAFMENMRQMQIAKMEEQGMSDAQIEQAMPMVEMFSSPIAMFIMIIIFGTFFGFLVALIMSAIFKKSNPEAI